MLPLNFTTAAGAAMPLKGKAVLVVNTASECGFTPQYADLQALWERFGKRGLVVLAMPCNDFGAQEPGSAEQIQSFCETRFRVSFPIAGKGAIVDPARRHPFYSAVAQELGEEQLPRWNFHKYLVGADGELHGSWPSKVSPQAKEIVEAIEALLS